MELNQDVVPVNLEEAIALVHKALTPHDLRTMRELTNISSLHHTLGRQIRNEWTLSDSDSPMRHWFRIKYEINHADDISTIVLSAVLQDLKKEPRDVQGYVNYCHNYWTSSIGKIMP